MPGAGVLCPGTQTRYHHTNGRSNSDDHHRPGSRLVRKQEMAKSEPRDDWGGSGLTYFLRKKHISHRHLLVAMNSKILFITGYILLFGSFGLAMLIFGLSPTTVFTLPKGVQPGTLLVALDSSPTLVFLTGVGFLLAGQLKQRSERVVEEL